MLELNLYPCVMLPRGFSTLYRPIYYMRLTSTIKASATGYGPRSRLIFDGEESKYELWEVKFLGFMRLQKLHKVILPESEGGSPEGELNAEKNAEAFAELVQCLDDRSLSLVLRDAKDNGREA